MNLFANPTGRLTGKIIGAAIDVHKKLGPGFTENIYHNAMKKELKFKEIVFESQKEIRILYREEEVGFYRVDLIVDSEVIVELKAVEEISKVHVAQTISYLKAFGLEVGLIINFSKTTIDIRRIKLNDSINYQLIEKN